MRKTFVPKLTKFKDRHGKRIPAEKYAEAAADYLENVQWSNEKSLPLK